MHSSVNVDECGLKRTFLFFNKGLLVSGGFFSNTSKSAPKINPLFKLNQSYILNHNSDFSKETSVLHELIT